MAPPDQPYSPTSPAESFGGQLPSLSLGNDLPSVPGANQGLVDDGDDLLGDDLDAWADAPVGTNLTTDATELGTEYKMFDGKDDSTEAVWGKTGAATSEAVFDTKTCPVLIVGSKLDQECALRPNRWINVGRQKDSQLLLQNAGVSRMHCSMRYDPHRRQVELRDTSATGTLINGEPIQKGRKNLIHGDRIRIDGKGAHWEFVLDMRPVGLGSADPRERRPGEGKMPKSGIAQRRDALRAQLALLEAAIKKKDAMTLEKEREFYELATRRRLRVVEIKQKQEQIRKCEAETQELTEKLEESREEWLRKLDAEREAAASKVHPIVEETMDLQVKLEKIKLKKAELERTLNPTRYEIADALDPDPFGTEAESAAGDGPLIGGDSAEEDGLASLQVKPNLDPPMPPPGEMKADAGGGGGAAAAAAAVDADADLFGDFDSEEEFASSAPQGATSAEKRAAEDALGPEAKRVKGEEGMPS